MPKTSLPFSPDVLALNPDLAGKEKTARLHTGRGTGVFGEPQFRSKMEARAWREWAQTRGAQRVLYEPFTLHLAGARWTPDFVLVFDDPHSVLIIEVKPSFESHPSGRSSKHSVKQAAVEFSWLGSFFVLTMKDERWTLIPVGNSP